MAGMNGHLLPPESNQLSAGNINSGVSPGEIKKLQTGVLARKKGCPVMKIYTADRVLTEQGMKRNIFLGVAGGQFQFVASDQSYEQVTDFGNRLIVPGFIDVHTHGGGGYDLAAGSSAELLAWASFKAEHGVTGFLPTTSSCSLTSLQRAGQAITAGVRDDSQRAANILGWHLEGPFFDDGEKLGAQNREHIVQEFTADYRRLVGKFSDVIRYLTLDPLVEDADKIVAFCREKDIVVAAGHTTICSQEFSSCKDEGYSAVVHTFNGMKGLDHRQPGLAYSACMGPDLYAEIICDGFHVSPEMLKLFFSLKQRGKEIIITDAIKLAGDFSCSNKGSAPDSEQVKTTTEFAGQKVRVDKQGRVLLEGGTLAGSTLTMDRALQIAVNEVGLTVERAVKAASLNPARLLGIADVKGSIARGKDADFVVLDDDFQIAAVYCRGQKIS